MDSNRIHRGPHDFVPLIRLLSATPFSFSPKDEADASLSFLDAPLLLIRSRIQPWANFVVDFNDGLRICSGVKVFVNPSKINIKLM